MSKYKGLIGLIDLVTRLCLNAIKPVGWGEVRTPTPNRKTKNVGVRTSPQPTSYLFTGEQYDPNAGFYYLRARYYNPGNGRFVTRDTYSGNVYEPLTLHKYLYANANPVMYVDPNGRCSLSLLQEIFIAEAIIHSLYSVGHKVALSYHLKASTKVIWSGTISTGLYTKGIFGAGGFYAKLDSEPVGEPGLPYHKGYQSGKYLFYFMGISLGLAFSGSLGEVELETPYFHSDPDDLEGLVSYISPVTIAPLPPFPGFPHGISFSSFCMGSGRGKFGWGNLTGLDYSLLNFMAGLAIRID